MASNLLLLETSQQLKGMGSPSYDLQWGNLCLDILSYSGYRILEDEDLPWTKLYVGINQSLHCLGISRDRIHLLGFEFNSGDYAYWRSSQKFVEDLIWVREKKQVDLNVVSPLGYLTSLGVKPGNSFRLEQKDNGLILEKIMEARGW